MCTKGNGREVSVCDALKCSNSAGATCHAKTPFATILRQVLKRPQIKLVYIDNKLESLGQKRDWQRKRAGANLANSLKSNLFDRGFRGKVIINSYNDPDKSQLLSAAYEVFTRTSFKSRVFYTADGGKDEDIRKAASRMKAMKDNLHSSMKFVYVGGVSTCYPADWTAPLTDARNLRGNLEPDYVIGWTYDAHSSLDWAAKKRISLITNYPGRFDDYIKRNRVQKCS